jgi:hypothetical protein
MLSQMKSFIVILLIIAANTRLFSQQIADLSYDPPIPRPQYASGKGPVLFIDEGHYNFHKKDGRYSPFAKLLEKDGYEVKGCKGAFETKKLKEGKILVIANALNKQNTENWYLPTPSAFTGKEISIVNQWVTEGGSLFLIADHMPFAGAAMQLAASFGFEFTNGFALDTLSQDPSSFGLADGTLVQSVITLGRDTSENVHHVATFTGQAIKPSADGKPILVFNNHHKNFLPDTAWQFTVKTPKYNIGGWWQGAFRQFGEGKVVVFGEAAMFSAQLAGPNKSRTGMNSAVAAENYKLLLNIIHWLDSKLD